MLQPWQPDVINPNYDPISGLKLITPTKILNLINCPDPARTISQLTVQITIDGRLQVYIHTNQFLHCIDIDGNETLIGVYTGLLSDTQVNGIWKFISDGKKWSRLR